MKRPPVTKASATPAETGSAAQSNAETIAKLTEVLYTLCGSPAPSGLTVTAPGNAGPVETVSAAEFVDALLNRIYRRMPKSGTKDTRPRWRNSWHSLALGQTAIFLGSARSTYRITETASSRQACRPLRPTSPSKCSEPLSVYCGRFPATDEEKFVGLRRYPQRSVRSEQRRARPKFAVTLWAEAFLPWSFVARSSRSTSAMILARLLAPRQKSFRCDLRLFFG